jgi:hypothetical protein
VPFARCGAVQDLVQQFELSDTLDRDQRYQRHDIALEAILEEGP